jgi:hypothetical protein
MKNDLGLKASKPSFVNELSDADMHRRYDACQHFQRVFEKIPQKVNVVLTSARQTQECLIWSADSPHFFQELENVPPHVIIRTVMTALKGL